MQAQARREYLAAIHGRYQQAGRPEKSRILMEFCEVTGYHRKYALRRLNGPSPGPTPPRRRRRAPQYGPGVVQALRQIWDAAGYPWSVRLKALLPLWLPWARRRLGLSAAVCQHLRQISARQIDRVLAPHKRELKRRRYGRTKPGTLLKHHIPVKTDRWDVAEPGFTELDLVAHCGARGEGEFAHSLNVTDVHTTWVETRAVLGRGEVRVQEALEAIRQLLPFRLRGIDADNGSEFINDHLYRYCQAHEVQFTRGRPYKKDDNAHIEQKNWTHVRKLVGYHRYDTPAAVAALNALYTGELRLLQNLFLPSVKLVRKERVGARVRRRYDAPCTPLERVLACPEADPAAVAHLVRLRDRLDPFALAAAIDRQLDQLVELATHPGRAPAAPAAGATPPAARPPRFDYTFGNHLRRPRGAPASVTS
ncbi:MAG TPA: integrase [Methylomirabilota bacterium]|nr:integrase [Methylomirabilota bacterium]